MAKVTIRDVARHASVSTATVSHVINGTRFVKEETKQKVLDSIAALDFTPDVMARSFALGKRNLIGFVVPDIVNVFYSEIIEEVENTIARHHYRLLTVHTKETKQREAESIRSLANGMVDGIIVTSTMEHFSEIQPLTKEGIPMVFVDRLLPGCPYDTVLVNNYSSVAQGVQQLITDGHRRMGFITGLSHLSTTLERLNAYRDTLHSNGIPVEESLIRQGDSMSQSAVTPARELLEAGCTALVISNNVMTDNVIQFLQQNDVPIGQKGGIDIVGYNDSGTMPYALRSIHSIDQPTRAMGRTIGEQIVARIQNPTQPIKQIILEATLTKKNIVPKAPAEKPLKWVSLL